MKNASDTNSNAVVNPNTHRTLVDNAAVITDALKVMVLAPKIRAFLETNDPKALAQAELALGRVGIYIDELVPKIVT
jgi:hypothetical protein